MDQSIHAFGVDDVASPTSIPVSESDSQSCSLHGSLLKSATGSFFLSAEGVVSMVHDPMISLIPSTTLAISSGVAMPSREPIRSTASVRI